MRRTGRGGSASRESEGKGGREGGRGVDLWEKKKGTHVHACIGRGEKSGYQCSSCWYLHLHIHVDTCTCTWCISSSCSPTLPFTISFYLVPSPLLFVFIFSLPPPSPPPPNVCIRRANTDRRHLCYTSRAQGLLLPMWLPHGEALQAERVREEGGREGGREVD